MVYCYLMQVLDIIWFRRDLVGSWWIFVKEFAFSALNCPIAPVLQVVAFKLLKWRIDASVVSGGQNNWTGVIGCAFELVDNLRELTDCSWTVNDSVRMKFFVFCYRSLGLSSILFLSEAAACICPTHCILSLTLSLGLIKLALMLHPSKCGAQQRQSFTSSRWTLQ